MTIQFMHMRPFILLASLWLGSTAVHGQTEMMDLGRVGHAAFVTSVVTDYQCVSINPANLGFSPSFDLYRVSTPLSVGVERGSKPITFGFGQVGASIRSDAMTKPQVLDLILQRESATAFTPADQLRAAQEFANRGLRFNADALLFGISYQSRTYGGFAITARERLSGSFILNKGASEIIFQGRRAEYFDSSYTNWRGDTIGVARKPQLFSQLFDGTRLSMSWAREYSFSYGLPLVIGDGWRLCMGATGKLLQSYAFLDAQAGNGEFTAYSALSPWFLIDYGKATTPSAKVGTTLVPIGQGYGADIGLTFKSSSFSLGVSVIDIGEMRYDGNVFSAADTIVNGLGTTGFGNYNLFEQAPKLSGDGNYFVWSGLVETRVKLPTRMRLGGSFNLGYRLSAGFDMTAPLRDVGTNPRNLFATAGISYRPFVWLTIGTGIGSGDGMEIFIPGTITLSILGGYWEMGVSTLDLSSLFTDRLPVLSANVAFLRFRL
jgi:hypothetical protein